MYFVGFSLFGWLFFGGGCYITGVLKVSLCFTVILLLFVKKLGSLLALTLHNAYILVNTAIRQLRKMHYSFVRLCSFVYMQKCLQSMRLYSSICDDWRKYAENLSTLLSIPHKKHSLPWGQSNWQHLSPMTGKICFAEGLHLIFIKHSLGFMRIYALDYKYSPVKRLLEWFDCTWKLMHF